MSEVMICKIIGFSGMAILTTVLVWIVVAYIKYCTGSIKETPTVKEPVKYVNPNPIVRWVVFEDSFTVTYFKDGTADSYDYRSYEHSLLPSHEAADELVKRLESPDYKIAEVKVFE